MVTRRDEPVASFVVGSRVSVLPGGDAATVRYAGLVAGTTGEWVGVEFDVPGRGKHDGTHGGVRYFATQPGGGPAGASFVRAHKLRRGVSLLEALQLKYQDGNALVERSRNEAPRPDEFYVESTRGRRVEVELVMKAELMEGQRHLDHLKRAYLPDAPVATAGPRGELGSHAQALEVLDLQGSLLRDWHEISRLNEELPALQVLDLSRTRLLLPLEPPSGSPFPRLRTLVLNDTGASWAQVCALHPLLPCLEELHCCRCGIASLSGADAQRCWPRLRRLSLEENALTQWAEVERLSALASLEALHLGGNGLESVSPPPTGVPSAWARLGSLFLASNSLSSWASVDALDAFPALIELRVSGNPVVEGGAPTRFEVVARITRLALLNGASVGRSERREAEIRYLRRALDEGRAEEAGGETTVTPPARPGGAAPAPAAHPRLACLLAAHGDLAPGVAPAGAARPVGGARLADDMLSLTLRVVAPQAGERADAERRVPRTLSTTALRSLCARVAKLPPARVTLFVASPGAPQPQPLEDDGRDLYYWGVESGSTILIDAAP